MTLVAGPTACESNSTSSARRSTRKTLTHRPDSSSHKTVIDGSAPKLPGASHGIVVADRAVAPVNANHPGARRVGQGRVAVSVSGLRGPVMPVDKPRARVVAGRR